MFTLITCLQVVINCCHGNIFFEIFIHSIIYKYQCYKCISFSIPGILTSVLASILQAVSVEKPWDTLTNRSLHIITLQLTIGSLHGFCSSVCH